jgi:photosystem II stability/assembly factor-like uncharacterized protein
MRRLLTLVLVAAALVAAALAQTAPQTHPTHSNENLRGVSAVSRQIAWASGTHGTYLRTNDGGQSWSVAQVPGAEGLDFRGVVAFSAEEAFLMSAGSGGQSRIYHTSDGGQHWALQYSETNPKGFFDCMAFWDRSHGIVLGDPIADESGKLKFELLMTTDGKSWSRLPAAELPPAVEGEGAFAASNSCIAILGGADLNVWFATGGRAARVFHSADRGRTWEVFETPLVHGAESEGIFSIAFRDAMHGVIAGGDYKRPEEDGPNLAFSDDGGKTWKLSEIYPQSYYSAVAYDRRSSDGGGKGGEGQTRLFIAGPKFIYDFRPPQNPTRISPPKKSGVQFNAVSAYAGGGAIFAGPQGSIAIIP